MHGFYVSGRVFLEILLLYALVFWRMVVLFHFLLLYAWVLKINRPGACYMHGFFGES